MTPGSADQAVLLRFSTRAAAEGVFPAPQALPSVPAIRRRREAALRRLSARAGSPRIGCHLVLNATKLAVQMPQRTENNSSRFGCLTERFGLFDHQACSLRRRLGLRRRIPFYMHERAYEGGLNCLPKKLPPSQPAPAQVFSLSQGHENCLP
jgi:hypothetical protein